MSATSCCAADLLRIDAATETERIAAAIRDTILSDFKRKGAVVAVSGGIDSSVVLALCVRALGSRNVVALLLPEAESSPDSFRLGQSLAQTLGVRSIAEDITPILKAAGCYQRRDEAIRGVVPDYVEGWKSKIVLPNLLDADRYAVFSLVVQSPDGVTRKVRLPLQAYLGILAATNFKQRTRKMLEYHYADRFHYAVAGTPNRLEHDLGFFVKNGDGSADLKPIGHLYKTQVYQLAVYLDIPEEIQNRPSTTDTYSLSQSQEEFYFSLPLEKMDLCLYGKNNGISPQELAPVVNLSAEEVVRAYEMINAKERMTRYLVSEVLFPFKKD